GEVLFEGQHRYRMKYKLPPKTPKVGIIAKLDDVSAIEKIISGTDYPQYETHVLVRSASSALMKLASRVVVHEYRADLKSSAANLNQIARACEADILVFLNGSYLPKNVDWLHELASQAIRDEIGACGAKLLDNSGRIMEAGMNL